MILSFPFPKASFPPDASDRGALPLNGAPVAPILVCRLQYRDGSAVCFSTLRAPVLPGTRDHRGILNWFGRPARRIVGHSASRVCQDFARHFADLLHFNLSAPKQGLVALTDGHSNSERKSACPNQDGTNPY